jgi:hypothetical protein
MVLGGYRKNKEHDGGIYKGERVGFMHVYSIPDFSLQQVHPLEIVSN